MKKMISDDLVMTIKDYVLYIEKQEGNGSFADKLAGPIEDLIIFVKVFYPKEYLTFGMPIAMKLTGAEQIINKSLKEDMKKGIFYKEIYQNVRAKVKIFAELHGQTEVIEESLRLEAKEIQQRLEA